MCKIRRPIIYNIIVKYNHSFKDLILILMAKTPDTLYAQEDLDNHCTLKVI